MLLVRFRREPRLCTIHLLTNPNAFLCPVSSHKYMLPLHSKQVPAQKTHLQQKKKGYVINATHCRTQKNRSMLSILVGTKPLRHILRRTLILYSIRYFFHSSPPSFIPPCPINSTLRGFPVAHSADAPPV